MNDFDVFSLGDVSLQSGQVLTDAKLAYKTYGKLNGSRDNVIVLPTFYTGTHVRNEGFFGTGRSINPEKHFIVSINLFGNGLSSSPSNTAGSIGGGNFPKISLYDNITCQYQLLTEYFQIEEILLVTGWSMAGCQSFQWAAQYPSFVRNIVPFCASAKTSPHNYVFLEGVKSALLADSNFKNGFYKTPPASGLKAFARVYAGWAFSQTWYRDALYKEQGFESIESLLLDWENDHLNWDANDLLLKLGTWQAGDISDNKLYNKDFAAALGGINANTIVIACDNDLYFQPRDNELEMAHIKNGELRVFRSPWGHCVASPGNKTGFQSYFDSVVAELIG
jgi:homoserine O-acetyltransferase/O-succinyltransferase